MAKRCPNCWERLPSGARACFCGYRFDKQDSIGVKLTAEEAEKRLATVSRDDRIAGACAVAGGIAFGLFGGLTGALIGAGLFGGVARAILWWRRRYPDRSASSELPIEEARARAGELPPVFDLLRSPDSDARSRAAQQLAALEDDAAVGPLVSALQHENDRSAQIEISRALCALTGEDFGYNARRWHEWWERRSAKHGVDG